MVLKETGIHLQIISGNTEAHAGYLGVINTIDIKNGIIFDLGGDSTELAIFKNRRILESVSIPVWAVNTTAIFNARDRMPSNIFNDISLFVMGHLDKYPWLKNQNISLIGVGGTARTVAKIIQRRKKYPLTKIHNYSFSANSFREYFTELQSTGLEERSKISGLSAERSDIILAGSSIINYLLETTDSKKMIISGCGLREGLFLEYYCKNKGQQAIADDILKRSRDNIMKLYAPDISHSKHVSSLALAMFDNWTELHGLAKSSRRILRTAALLHDIGITINFYSHARHSAYMIQNAQLFGLSHREQIMAAVIAGWHNGISKAYSRDRFYRNILSESNWKVINCLALLLALAESLDYSQTGQINKIKPAIDKNGAILSVSSRDNTVIGLQQAKTYLPWFKKTFNLDLRIGLLT
ncbi:MAG: Ppx/GppA family phosphatase [Phascolarctobacterium sp.]|nr:Ppx/GppA family phosphatase [Phascolarctobacterium sp.]